MKRRRKLNNLAIFAIIMGAFTMASCSSDDNGVEQEVPVATDELVGSIHGAHSLDESVSYTITGPVIVEEGAELNIPAGTTIKAKKGFNNYILVLQGGKINIRGTADKPVKITADIEDAEEGHWGGLIINGKAPLAGGTIGSTEISSAHPYGGNDPDDNSGVITYLELHYTGARSSADVEHNGLTLNGVGAGTTIENLFISNGADDGIEFFGGNVNVKNLLVVNSDDDMFDFTQGYTGTLENTYGIWEEGFTSSESDPRGIEADGNLDGNFPDHSNQANFTVRNITFDLRLSPAEDSDTQNVTNKMQDVIKIRRGAKATLINGLVKGTGTVIDLVDFTDGKGEGDVTSSISLTNMLSEEQILGQSIYPTTEYENVYIEEGNAGCPTSIFSWTGYNF